MKNETTDPADRSDRITPAAPKSPHRFRGAPVWAVLAVALFCSATRNVGDGDDDEDRERTNGARQLRQFIDQQVGGIEKLMVPANDADLPQPRLPNGDPDPFFETTEAKRFLGKMLFHDPVRMVRVLPEFGGIPETAQSASCGSCHFGAAASKAGTLLNFAAGGEGLGYTDRRGRFIPRRRARVDLLPRLRQRPLFPGDALVDELPTLTDVYENVIGSPALQELPDETGMLLRTGRLDALDSVGRNAPSVIGSAFHTRLLLDGFAGEPDETRGGLNPFHHPAQENVALLLLDAHRMLSLQAATLQGVPAFVKLFQDAFPEEAEQAAIDGDPDLLINDMTVLRATASFLRTVVTRNTPWDGFLAGDDRALTAAQRRGARLFFTEAQSGGAGCFTCHSGPMLNKQFDDPDVAGVGVFVEENFHNLGLRDHPLQALNRAVRGDPSFRDEGRKEITGREDDAFEFRTLTLRQLRDGRFFMHNGAFTSVEDVVEYFNEGRPQDREAGAAATLSPRFTHPRGPGSRRGLGLDDDEVEDLVEFLEDALYDPSFVHFDPSSTTDTFQANERDLTYSRYRPELAALGARDGFMPSGRPQDNDDPLSRRDMGLEFLDVTPQVVLELEESESEHGGREQEDEWRIRNVGSTPIDTHLLVIVEGLPDGVRLDNASGMTKAGAPYCREFLRDGVLLPGKSLRVELEFEKPRNSSAVSYTLTLLSGQGDP